jgi:hypothetical protein
MGDNQLMTTPVASRWKRLRRRRLPLLVILLGFLALGTTGLSGLGDRRADADAVSGLGRDDAPLFTEYGRTPSGDTPQTNQGPVKRQENCDANSSPETSDMGGSVTIEDRESGRSSKGYWCNMKLVGLYGPNSPQGFEGSEWQLARYKNCAYYSQRTVNPGVDRVAGGTPVSEGVTQKRPGTVVVDVSDPTNPKFAKNLTTLGMYDPWETVKVSQARGLLAAVDVMDGTGVSYMGIYDVSSGDCANPVKLFDGQVTAVNHEGNISADGMTYYTGGLTGGVISAIDIADPRNPKLLTTFFAKAGIHGMSTSPDGKRLYLSHINEDWPYTMYVGGSTYKKGAVGEETLTGGNGFGIYDISEIQERKPNPQVRLISALEYPDAQLGQHTLNWKSTKDGKLYAAEVSEKGGGGARIIDITDEKTPTVISKVKTEIMMPENADRAFKEIQGFRNGKYEYGGDLKFGYNIHYCNIDKKIDPTMLACSGFESGMRLYDIRDVHNPKELGYYNPGGDGTHMPGGWCGTYSGYTAAMPQFEPTKHQIWFTDQCRGFYVVEPTNGTWISDVTEETLSHGV